ncbi:MAG: hypothetical protein V1701_03015 [Planctomycetota bacterium]
MQEELIAPMRPLKEWRPEPQFQAYLQALPYVKDWDAFRSIYGLRLINPTAPTYDLRENWHEVLDNFVKSYFLLPQYQAYNKETALLAKNETLKPQIADARTKLETITAAYAQKYTDNFSAEQLIKSADEYIANADAQGRVEISGRTVTVEQLQNTKTKYQKQLESGEPEEEQLRSEKEQAEWDLFLLIMMTTPRYWELIDADPGYGEWLKTDKPSRPVFDANEEIAAYQVADLYYEEYKGAGNLKLRMMNGLVELGLRQVHPGWRQWAGSTQAAWQDSIKAIFDSEGLIYTVDNVAAFVSAVTDDPAWATQIQNIKHQIHKKKAARKRRAFYGVLIIIAIIVCIVYIVPELFAKPEAVTSATGVTEVATTATIIPTTIPEILSSVGLPSELSAAVGATGTLATLIDSGVNVANDLVAAGMNKDEAAKKTADTIVNDFAPEEPVLPAVQPKGIQPLTIGLIAGGVALTGLTLLAVARRN